MKKPTFEQIAKRLRLQNQPLDTSTWIAWKAEDKSDGTFYHVSVEENDIEFIKSKMSRLFYCFTKIKINLPKASNGEGVKANADSNTVVAQKTQ